MDTKIVVLVMMCLVSCLEAVPGDRMRVKYRIKSGGGKRVVDKAVAEAVPAENEVESDLPTSSSDQIQQVLTSLNEATEQKEAVQQVTEQEERLLGDTQLVNDVENTKSFQVIDTMVGMAEELSQVVGTALGGSYSNVVGEMAQGIERAARFNDGSVSDVMFDVVKEVVSELVGGLLSSTLGIGTARNGGGDRSIVEIILTAISNAGRAKTSCRK